MTFSFHIALSICAGSNDDRQNRQDNDGLGDIRPVSAVTQQTTVRQRRNGHTGEWQAQQQREREQELEADRTSLYDLETTSSTPSSERARESDERSLAMLEKATSRQNFQRRWRSDTPPSAWNYPIIHKLKDVDGGPMRHSQRISPSLHPPASGASSAVAAELKRKEMRADLKAAGRNDGSIEGVASLWEHKREGQVESEHKWIVKLEARKAGDVKARTYLGMDEGVAGGSKGAGDTLSDDENWTSVEYASDES